MGEKVAEKPSAKKDEKQSRGATFSRASGPVSIHMTLKTKVGENKLEWNFQAQSMVAAVTEGKRLCLNAKKKWPQDVIVWENS